MRSILRVSMNRLLAQLCLSFLMLSLLGGCGSGSSSNTASPQATGVSGVVYVQQGPVEGATVTVKSYDGQTLGTAITDVYGAYLVPTLVAGPYIAQATEVGNSRSWFGVSQNGRMNITHIGDFMIRLWYEAYSQNATDVFSRLNSTSNVPEESGIDLAVDLIAAYLLGVLELENLDINQDELTPTIKRVLQATSASGHTVTINSTDPYVDLSLVLDANINSEGEVVFAGQQVFNAVGYSNPNSVEAVIPNVNAVKQNAHWMSDYWDYIKDRKLSDIAIPGTHDSGTYKLGWGSGINTAKTQTVSLGQQLKDGIRYLDMRVTEAAHTGCADGSVWWLYHTWKSYRLQEGLDEIKTFINTPANSKEVLILDFQDVAIGYNDARAIDVLLALIQTKLGDHLVPMDQVANWHNSTLSEFVAQGRRIIVLMPTSTSTRVNASGFSPGCGAAFNPKYFAPRGGNLRSYYAELQTSAQIQEQVLTPQLQKDSPLGNNLFDLYRTQQSNGLLTVLQIVPRPSNLWYTGASASLSWGFPVDLLTYSGYRINAPLNLKMSQADVDSLVLWSTLNPFAITNTTAMSSYCQSGWLGKRLVTSLQGDSSKWNKPNIIILDNYNPMVGATKFNWVMPKHNGTRWVADWQGGYVDYVIRLNTLSRNGSLANVTGFNDDQCLDQ